jgi:signal transduction histidine kinase
LTHVLRQYSETITGIIQLDEIVNYWNQTLRSVFNVQQGGLILIDSREGSAALQFMGADVPECEGELAKGGILYERLFLHRHSLLQEDLLQAAAYKDVPESERRFFETLAMSVYTPIIVGEGKGAEPIGILACGTKMHGQAFSPQDRELLATLANQTGVALRNARLVNDLVTLNEEMKSLNKELQVSAENFERLDGVKTDFVTIASHELRTPLAQVRGYTDMIAMMNDGNEEHDPYKMEGYIDGLRKAANRLEGLIGAMLDVSKLDVDSLDLHFALTSMESVIRTAIEPLIDAMNERKLTFSARGLRGLPPIQADSQRLVQAFGNIISNAIKFTPDGGRIEVQGEAVNGENGEASAVLLKVEDTGVGIAPENLELIFEKFFRGYDPSLHSTGATKFMGAGPGLGLTIARGVINGHGGRIWAESTGHDAETLPGSTFFIRLPVVPPEDTHRLSIEETVVASLPESGAKAYRQSQYDKEKTLPHL